MKRLIYILIVAISWASCSEDIDYDTLTTTATGEAGSEVVVDLTVGSALYLSSYTRSNPMGDSTQQTQFNSGDKIAIATTTGDTEPESSDYLTYAYDGSSLWKTSGDTYLEWNGTYPQYFWAYYPVNDDTSYDTFTLPTDQRTEEKMAEADYMKAAMSVTSWPSKGVLNLEMERQTAKIKVRINDYSNQFSNEPTIDSLIIYSRYSTISEDAEQDITPIGIYKEADDNSKSGYSYYALVAPNAEADSIMVDTVNNEYSIPHPLISVIIKDSNNDKDTLTVTPNNVYPQLEKGYCYQYALNIGKDTIAVDGTTVTAFDNDTLPVDQSKRVAYYDLDSTVTISTAWLSANITMKETTLYLSGTMDSNELDTLRTWAQSGNAGDDANLILDLTNLTGDIPDASETAITNNDYYTLPTTNTQYLNQYTGITTIILPSADDSEAKKRTRSNSSGISIGKDAFYGLSNLTAVVNSDNISSISKGTFFGCVSLTSLDLSNVTEIPDYALVRCYELADLDISGATSIGSYSLFLCSALMEYESEAVITIGERAFQNCASLLKVSVPNATSIDEYAFYFCINLKEADVSGLSMSSTIYNNYYLSSDVSSNLFAFCYSLETVKWSEAANFIPNYCFYYCYSLKNLSGVGNVQYVGEEAFQRCTALEELPEDFTDNLLAVDVNSFRECYSLKSVKLNNATWIGNFAFMNCTGIETVEISGTEYVVDYAFKNCYALKSVKGEKVYRLNGNVFENCTSLTDVYLPVAYEANAECFRGCTALEYIDLPTLNYAFEYCFRDCTSLKEAHLQNLVDFSNHGVFWGCTALEEVEMGPGGLMEYTDALGGYYFRDCKSLKKLDFSNYYKGDHTAYDGSTKSYGNYSVAPCCHYTTSETAVSSTNSDSIAFQFNIHTWRSIKYPKSSTDEETESSSESKVYYPTDYPNDTAVYQPAFYGCNVENIYIYVHDEEVKERLSLMFTKRALTYDDFKTLYSYENVNYIRVLSNYTDNGGLGWKVYPDDTTSQSYWEIYYPELGLNYDDYTETERLILEAIYYYTYAGAINAHYFGWGWNGFTEEYVDHIRVKDK